MALPGAMASAVDRLRKPARARAIAPSLSRYSEEHLPGRSAASADANPRRRPLAPAGLDSPRIALSRSAVIDRLFRRFSGPEGSRCWSNGAVGFVREQWRHRGDRSQIDRIARRLHLRRPRSGISRRCHDSPNRAPEVVGGNHRPARQSGRSKYRGACLVHERRERAAANDIAGMLSSRSTKRSERVMADIVVWTVRNPALSTRRRWL